MRCTHCFHPFSQIIYVIHNDDHSLTERRRQCNKCGMRFTTWEKVRHRVPLKSTKRDDSKVNDSNIYELRPIA